MDYFRVAGRQANRHAKVGLLSVVCSSISFQLELSRVPVILAGKDVYELARSWERIGTRLSRGWRRQILGRGWWLAPVADGRPFLEMQAIVRQAFNQYFIRNAKLREFCRRYQDLSDSGNASASSRRIPEECQVWSGESGRAWQTLAELRQDLARLGTFLCRNC